MQDKIRRGPARSQARRRPRRRAGGSERPRRTTRTAAIRELEEQHSGVACRPQPPGDARGRDQHRGRRTGARADVDPARISARASGDDGVALLLAAAVNPRSGPSSLDRTPHSVRAAIDSAIHTNLHDAVIPGFAVKWDLTDLRELMRPADGRVEGPDRLDGQRGRPRGRLSLHVQRSERGSLMCDDAVDPPVPPSSSRTLFFRLRPEATRGRIDYRGRRRMSSSATNQLLRSAPYFRSPISSSRRPTTSACSASIAATSAARRRNSPS